jgi:hypothetical protein
MMSTGWAIWHCAGIDSNQAFDFLSDGYTNWQKTPQWTRELAQQYLSEMMDGLANNPTVPPNFWQRPQEEVLPAANHYGARCWAASKLWQILTPDQAPARARAIYDAIAVAPRDFVPPLAQSVAKEIAAPNGWPEPWV